MFRLSSIREKKKIRNIHKFEASTQTVDAYLFTLDEPYIEEENQLDLSVIEEKSQVYVNQPTSSKYKEKELSEDQPSNQKISETIKVAKIQVKNMTLEDFVIVLNENEEELTDLLKTKVSKQDTKNSNFLLPVDVLSDDQQLEMVNFLCQKFNSPLDLSEYYWAHVIPQWYLSIMAKQLKLNERDTLSHLKIAKDFDLNMEVENTFANYLHDEGFNLT